MSKTDLVLKTLPEVECREWQPPSREALWVALDSSRRVRGCLEANESNPHPQHVEAALAEARSLVSLMKRISG